MIYDSIIVTGSAQVSGSLSVTGGITGSLQGTATTASYVLNAVSASFATSTANATTASYTLNAISSSFATTAATASYLTPTNNYQMNLLGVGVAPTAPFKGNFYGQVIIQNGINNATGQQSLIFSYPGITNSLTHSIFSGHDASVASYNKLDFYIARTSGLSALNVLSLRSSQPVLIGAGTGLGLDVSGSTTISGSLSVSGSITSTSTITAQTLVVQTITSSVLYSSGSNVFGNSSSNTQIMTGSVLITGSVGIGTASPSATLDVQTSSGVGSSTASGLSRFITAGTTTAISIGQSNSARKLDIGSQSVKVTSDDFYLVNASANATIFENNGAERMRITSSGSVGIGTTSPNAKLEINNTSTTAIQRIMGTGATTAQLLMGGSSHTSASVGIQHNSTGQGIGDMLFLTSATDGALSERMRISGSGNIGIGTTSPRTRLQVTPASNGEVPVLGTATGMTTFTSANGNYGIQFNSTSDGSFHIQSQRFDAISTAYSLILNYAGGNVGIGSLTSPSNLLSVRGNADFGTTGYANVSPVQYGALTFPRGQILFSNTNTQNQLYISSNAYNNAGGVFAYRSGSAPAIAIGLDNGVFSVLVAGSGTADATISFTTALSIINSGVATFSSTVQPGANGTQDLGTASLRWATVYTSDLSLSNGIGDYTIVEGEDDLFLYNNKSNKVYKFMLAEVDPANATPKKST